MKKILLFLLLILFIPFMIVVLFVKDDEITRNEKPIRIREYLDKKIIFLKMNLI